MAGLHGFHSTCSMSELGLSGSNEHVWDRDEDATVKKIKSKIKRVERNNYGSPPSRQRHAIICNTIHYHELLLKCGFTEVAQYNGNDGDVVHVMLWINPKYRVKQSKKGTGS